MDSPIDLLCHDMLDVLLAGVSPSTERLYVRIESRWAAALVCRRWHEIIRSARLTPSPEKQFSAKCVDDYDRERSKRAVRGRLVYASDVASIASRFSALPSSPQVHQAVLRRLEEVVRNVAGVHCAHLAVVMLASGCGQQAAAVAALARTAPWHQDAPWTELHKRFDSFQGLKRKRRLKHFWDIRCNHAHLVERMACALASAAAVYAPPAVLAEALRYKCTTAPLLERATAHAVAADRVDAFECAHNRIKRRQAHMDGALAEQETARLVGGVWNIVGSCGSFRVARHLQGALPVWPTHRRKRAKGTAAWQTNAVADCLQGACCQDNVEALDLFTHTAIRSLGIKVFKRLFGSAFESDSVGFCERLIAIEPRLAGPIASACIDDCMVYLRPDDECAAARWVLTQPWYQPT